LTGFNDLYTEIRTKIFSQDELLTWCVLDMLQKYFKKTLLKQTVVEPSAIGISIYCIFWIIACPFIKEIA